MPTILLNKNNLFHNLDEILSKTKDKSKIAPVLKDNAYGHGLMEIATLLKEYGISKAVVRTVDDAKKIEKLFPYILILADTTIHTYSHTFHIAVNSLNDIERLPKNSNIHLKVDTGMHRNGISPNELESAINRAFERDLKITGVFTHYRSADILSSELFFQKEIFKNIKVEVKNICEKLSLPLPSFHSCNSAALFRCENFDEDFARIGIATYGYVDNKEPLFVPNLKPVLSLEANIISCRKISKGERVGYGGTYEAEKEMNVSTYDVGYGDGFFRINENQIYHTPKGFQVLGRVSMDNLSLNSTDEKVILFDDVKELAKIHSTITYEILTSLKPHLKRVVI